MTHIVGFIDAASLWAAEALVTDHGDFVALDAEVELASADALAARCWRSASSTPEQLHERAVVLDLAIILPAARLQPPFQRDQLALAEILAADPGHAVSPVGFHRVVLTVEAA